MFPLTIPVALLYVFLLQFGGGFGAQSFFQLWSAEMFPTAMRTTAQGVCFAMVRIGLGIFSFLCRAGRNRFYTPWPGYSLVSWWSGVIGWLWAPRNQGKSLEQLEAERQAA